MTEYKYWKWTNTKDGDTVEKSNRRIEHKEHVVVETTEKKRTTNNNKIRQYSC